MGKSSVLSKLKNANKTKKSASKILDEEKNQKITKATGNNQSYKRNTGSAPKRTGTQTRKTNTTGKSAGTQTNAPKTAIPNTNPTTIKNVYKKGNPLTVAGLGALLGGVGTYVAGLAKDAKEAIITPPEETPIIDGTLPEEGAWWDEANSEAAALLEPLEDIPLVGDAVESAATSGLSLPLAAGLALAATGAGILIYKKVSKKGKGKTTQTKKATNPKKGGKKRKKTAKK